VTTTVRGLVDALHRAGVAEVDTSSRRRAEYSTDASNYRVVPTAVVFPHDRDEVLAITDVAIDSGVPLTARGGGTSVAGNAVGTGIVIDYSRHMATIREVDPAARTARVQPGVTLGALQVAAAPFALRFGPDPSTWTRCTLGGMIGNNACGPRALAYGRTADNVLSLDVVDGLGRAWETKGDVAEIPGLDGFIRRHLATVRTQLGGFERQISGYSLEHLLPERGANLAKTLVGTEGTCVNVVEATVRLVEAIPDPLLVVLGYPDMATAADAVPALLPHHPTAIEGLDSRLVDAVRRSRPLAQIPDLSPGAGWLLVEVADADAAAALTRAERLACDAEALGSRIIQGPVARAMWRIREDGAGLAGRTPAGRQAWPGLEDAAVPPERLGAYLRRFEELLTDYGFSGMPYGHFGDGCVHVRLDIPLERNGNTLRRFMFDAARLIAEHGGSLSGEHGDGRARSELLPLMYDPDAIAAFAEFKTLFDPRNILNPGVIVDPVPLSAELRRPAAGSLQASKGLAFLHDKGDITAAVHRCVGVAKCRADNSASGGFMCPSYLATKDEKDSTRGRARVLQEALNGTLVHGLDAPEVEQSLDLCLSCKACSTDCPAGVDIAALKTEVLDRRYRGRLRPITHYTLGWIPRWARIGSTIPRVANLGVALRPIERALLAAGGMDTRRRVPRFGRSFLARNRRRHNPFSPTSRMVYLWVDSFCDAFAPDIPAQAVEVLERLGLKVMLPRTRTCCGLTWISTGQLGGARRRLRSLVDELAPVAAAGIPILGLEPSCTAVLRRDLLELLRDDRRVEQVASHVFTFAELVSSPRSPCRVDHARLPRLDGTRFVVQPHCHHHAVMDFEFDRQLLRELGAEVTEISGCCGLAGNFGMERGHYDVSVAVARHTLLPALCAAGPGAEFIADGISCRTQASQLANVNGRHLIQLIHAAL
jgi:FAD/FMN-containing dehydrogenase/Fe-S oxidoreductase